MYFSLKRSPCSLCHLPKENKCQYCSIYTKSLQPVLESVAFVWQVPGTFNSLYSPDCPVQLYPLIPALAVFRIWKLRIHCVFPLLIPRGARIVFYRSGLICRHKEFLRTCRFFHPYFAFVFMCTVLYPQNIMRGLSTEDIIFNFSICCFFFMAVFINLDSLKPLTDQQLSTC